MRLKDKIAIVTGAASGIGEASAKTFAREGAAVLVADLNREDGMRVVGEIRATGAEAEFIAVDILHAADLEAMTAFALKRYGRIDVLHNNAQVSAWGRLGEVSFEDWQRALEGGLTSYWYASKLAVNAMLKSGGGAIVNTASVSGLAGDYGLGTYNVAKSAIVNMTRVFGIEYARRHIRCNAICPGPIATPPMLKADKRRPDIIGPIREAIPMGRLGTPQEVANVALFLASDESAFVTGAYVVVDGGLWAHSGMPPLVGVSAAW